MKSEHREPILPLKILQIIGFIQSRTLRDETRLQSYSIGETRLMSALKGKSIALVGNARSLSEQQYAPLIDRAEVIIRLNAAPIPSASSHGSRTDWIAMSVPVADDVIVRRAPSVLLWMTPKRKRLPWRLASDPRFFLNPRQRALDLRRALGAPCSTGLMVIDLIVRSQAAEITLYGFDFFESQSLSGRRNIDQVPHDFYSEREYVQSLMDLDARLSLVRPQQSN